MGHDMEDRTPAKADKRYVPEDNVRDVLKVLAEIAEDYDYLLAEAFRGQSHPAAMRLYKMRGEVVRRAVEAKTKIEAFLTE